MKKIILLPIKFYKNFFSLPFKSVFGGGCRFVPTCSDYARESIEKFGATKGSWLAFKRILKCNPFYNSEK